MTAIAYNVKSIIPIPIIIIHVIITVVSNFSSAGSIKMKNSFDASQFVFGDKGNYHIMYILNYYYYLSVIYLWSKSKRILNCVVVTRTGLLNRVNDDVFENEMCV